MANRVFSSASNTRVPRLPFRSVELQFGYTDQELTRFVLDTSSAKMHFRPGQYRILKVLDGSTKRLTDISKLFWLYGGLQFPDTSPSWVANLRGAFTAQLGRHQQGEAEFNVKDNDLSVNSGTWLQSEKARRPTFGSISPPSR